MNNEIRAHYSQMKRYFPCYYKKKIMKEDMEVVTLLVMIAFYGCALPFFVALGSIFFLFAAFGRLIWRMIKFQLFEFFKKLQKLNEELMEEIKMRMVGY